MPSVNTCRISCEVLAGQSSVAVFFQRRPDVVETLDGCLVQTNLLRYAEQLPAEIDGVDLRLLAILLPVGVEDRPDHVGVEQGCKRCQAFDGGADPDRHPRHRHQLRATGLDCLRGCTAETACH